MTTLFKDGLSGNVLLLLYSTYNINACKTYKSTTFLKGLT